MKDPGFSEKDFARLIQRTLLAGVFLCVFLLFLGFKFLLTKSGPSHVQFGPAVGRLEARFEKRFQGHSAFMTGLLRVMGNVGVLVFWIILAANFIYREWVSPDWPGKLAGVAAQELRTGPERH